MLRTRSLFAAVSPGFLVLALVITALLGLEVLSAAMSGISSPHDCALDMDRAIAAAERGEDEYNGTCFSYVLPPDLEVPEDFYQQRDEYQRRVDEQLQILTGDIWKSAGDRMGGFPLVLFSLIIGAYVAGSILASGTAAWSLSNGWTRTAWVRSLLNLTVLLVVSAYLLLTALFVIAVLVQVNGMGLTASLTAPGLSYLLPLPGLAFYALVGTGAGLLAGKGELGVMIAFVIAITDFVVAGYLDLLPVNPSSFHQAAVGSDMARISGATGALALAGAAAALALALHWYFAHRKDVPDR